MLGGANGESVIIIIFSFVMFFTPQVRKLISHDKQNHVWNNCYYFIIIYIFYFYD